MNLPSIRVAAANGDDKISFEGPGVSWGGAGQTTWGGFERVKLHLSETEVLVIEATPRPLIAKPQGVPSPSPTFTVNDADHLEGDGATRTLKSGRRLGIDFHWANPLTPAGAGIWFRLVIEGHSARLKVEAATRFYYARDRRRSDPDWTHRELGNTASLDDFARQANIGLISSTQNDRLGALLTSSLTPDSWIVDLRDLDDPPMFRLAPYDPVGGEQQLAASLHVRAASHHRSPASARALGGAGRALGRSTLFLLGDLTLRCARHVFPPRGAAPGNGVWLLDWSGVPAALPDTASDALSLPTVYRHVASHYPIGIAAARSRSRFTVVPTRVEGPAGESVTLRFRVDADGYGDARITTLQQVAVDVAGNATWLQHELGGAESIDGASAQVAFAARDAFVHRGIDQKPLRPEPFRSLTRACIARYPFALHCISYARATNAGQPAAAVSGVDWLLGGIRAQATQLRDASVRLSLEPRGEGLSRQPLGCDMQLVLEEGRLGPVGQDPEPGFEFLSSWLDRPRPISFDLREAGPDALRFTIEETANTDQSRIVRLTVDRTQAGDRFESDVAVIDPAPFTVARVTDALDLQGDTHIAEYSDDSEAPAGWEFRVGKGQMDIVLPPQSIGEEMVKGRLAWPGSSPVVEVPFAGEPFQYRFSPNAVITADRTDIDTARAPPPWMLRRLLNRRGGITGLKLDEAAFELVYGLTTRVTTRGLRIAELDALIGRVPFADAMVRLVRQGATAPLAIATAGGDGSTSLALKSEHARKQARWLLDLLHRPSWWPLFRSLGERGVLKIDEGVSVDARPTRNTAHPFQINAYANGQPEANRQPLRGGVDWLFQSPNIYEEFRAKPNSTAACIEGVAFGPLGGEGSQVASYANGKTLIISKTKQGHLESLVLMRIGRIARYWNHARHVIVYQRSSRRAPRYALGAAPYPGFDTYDEQRPGLEGFMALRKVREYIEITQPRRPLSARTPGIPLCGPIGQSTFETTILPVKASWARDIENGQLICLWGAFDPAEAPFFPRPKIFVEGARAGEKGAGLVPNEADHPNEYHFFTSTRPQDGADTDLWPAWPDVDDALWTPDHEPEGSFRPAFRASRKQPNARHALMGQGRFTTSLRPNAEAVDLMHGRQPNAIEARLHTVSAVRAIPKVVPSTSSLAKRVGEPLAKTDAFLADRLTELRDYAREHLSTGQATGSAAHQQFLKDASDLFGAMRPNVQALAGAITGDAARLAALAGAWADRNAKDAQSYAVNAQRELQNVDEMLRQSADVLGALSLDEARRSATAAVQTAALQAHQRIGRVNFLPDQALGDLRRAISGIGRFVSGALSDLSRQVARSFTGIQELYRANTENAEIAERQFHADIAKGLAAIESIGVGLEGRVASALGDLFAARGPVEAASTKVKDATSLLLQEIVEHTRLTVGEVPPFDLGEPDWGTLSDIALGLQPENDWLDRQVGDWLSTLSAALSGVNWREHIDRAQTQLEAQVEGHLERLRNAVDVEGLQAELRDAGGQLLSQGAQWLQDVEGSLANKLRGLSTDPLWRDIAGELNAAQAFAGQASTLLNALDSALTLGSVEDVVRELERAGAELADTFTQAMKHAERAIVEDLKLELKRLGRELLDEAAPTAFQVTRLLASGIDTDTLKCTRDALGYAYTRGQQMLDVTRASAVINDMGMDCLNALSAMVPFDRLRDRLLPQLANINLSDLLPDLCGLKLEHLFPELRILEDKLGEYDWLTVKHGFDKDRLTAWSDVSIDKQFESDAVLLSLPPVSVALERARLRAHIRVEAGADQQRVQDVHASIKADWKLGLGGKPVVTVRDGELVFGNDGRFDFQFESENLILAQELQFITEALKALLPQDEGLTIMPLLPGGISATLSLPLPDIGTGAFTLTGITLHYNLALAIAGGFEVRTGFWLSKPDRPFGLAILFLGGGGWAGVEVTYRPPGYFRTRVSIGISAGAFVAINFGFARGSAGLLFTAGVEFFQESGGGSNASSTAVSLGLLIWGEFSILCIASAYLRLTASVTYTNSGGMVARGRVEVRIRISFFYTLRVNRSFERRFSGGGGQQMGLFGASHYSPLEVIDYHFMTLDLP